MLKVSKRLKNVVVGAKDFAKIRDYIKQNYKKIFESIKLQIPGLMKGISESVSKQLNIDYTMEVAPMIPFSPHWETKNAIAFSMYGRLGISVEGANEKLILAVTSTVVNVSGKVLFMYCYAPQNELDWTRTTSKSWAVKVIESNTKPPVSSSSSPGIIWNKIIVDAIIGGFLALIIGLILAFISIALRKA